MNTTTHGDAEQGVGDAARRLTESTANLVRQEVDRVRDELTATVRQAGLGAGLLAGAGVCGVLGLASVHTVLLRTFERRLPPRAAAATLTVLYLAGAAALLPVARERLDRARRRGAGALDQAHADLDESVAAERPSAAGTEPPVVPPEGPVPPGDGQSG
ncbi:phage holin family protein [Kitasatospora sp. NPDC101157]|uniref:phage holin family protein n=1 Tax=Kitasatospora sp. NPDC101157 TaxID=3364098 RepID=UPI0038030D79